MKTCYKCKATKAATEFHKDKSRKDGLKSNCKACQKAYEAANREAIAKRKAAYHVANREAILEQKAAYEAANREVVAKRKAAHYKANPAKGSASTAKSMCGRAAPSWLNDSHHEAILCVYEVADALDYHVDHIVPRNHPLVSGLHVAWNLQALPPAKNMHKQNYLPLNPEFSFIHQHDGKAYDASTGELVATIGTTD
jgi:5-methylcytosine-specific restriction endonuclease McrA